MTEFETTGNRVDLNEASAEQLERELGLNSRLSREVVAYRAREGRLKALAELLNVPGFTPPLLRTLRPRVLI